MVKTFSLLLFTAMLHVFSKGEGNLKYIDVNRVKDL